MTRGGISQELKVLRLLMNKKIVTPMDALRECGCMRLSARIYDLKNIGYIISSSPVHKNGKVVAGYSLMSGVGLC